MQSNESNATLSETTLYKGKPRRINATERITRLQNAPTCKRPNCGRKRYKGSPTGLCYWCWKKWGKGGKGQPRNSGKQSHRDDMARKLYYAGRMGPKLQAFVEECIQQTESEQYDLSQELAIARDLLGEALELYEKAKQLPDNNPIKGNRLTTAGALMAQAMKEVRETCRVGGEAFNNAKDKYSVHTLVDIISQIKKMIRDCFDYDEQGLMRFDAMLTERLRLPKLTPDGTTITPDSDVMQMDDTVPRIIDSTATELLLLDCPQCNQQFNHPDLNCVCPQCNVALRKERRDGI